MGVAVVILKHLDHFITSVGLIAIGFWLIFDNDFFNWPPEMVPFANDDFWGTILIAVGFALFLWVMDGGESIKWGRRLLTASTTLIAVITVYQFIIWTQTGTYHSWISNAIFTSFVISTSRRSDTTHG